mgnify:CR=1 FL=1
MAPQPLIVECALLGVIWTFVAAQLQLYTRGNERKWHPPRALLVIPDLDQLLARFGGDLASLLASIRISLVRVGSTERLSVCGPFKREIFTLADWRRQDVYSDMAHLFDAAAAKGIPDTCHALLFHPTLKKKLPGTEMKAVVLNDRTLTNQFELRLEAAGQIFQLLQEPISLRPRRRVRGKRAREANADGTLDDAQPTSRQRTASATTTTTSSPPPPHSTAQGESDGLVAPIEENDPDAATTTTTSSTTSSQLESDDPFTPEENASIRALLAELFPKLFPGLSPDKPDE